MRRMRLLIILQLAGILTLSTDSWASEDLEARLYCYTGLYAGYETELPDDEVSNYRLVFDLGIEWIDKPIKSLSSMECVAFSWNAAIALDQWDVRQGIGPRLTWKLNDNWSIQTMAGLAICNLEDYSHKGIHTNNALVYRDKYSFNILYQTFSPNDEYLENGGKQLYSLYGGITLQGLPGGRMALVLVTCALGLLMLIATTGGISMGYN